MSLKKSQKSSTQVLTERLDKRYKYEVSLIHVNVVADGQQIRVSAHQTITVDQLLAIVRKLIGHQSSTDDWICRNDRTVLDSNKTLAECQIKDGAKLWYRFST